MRISLRQLQIFRAVAQEMSFTRAAEALNLTQPAVFTQVRQMEAALGHVLIERIGKRLFLTEAGRTVLETAREVLEAIDRMDMQLADLGGLARGRLRIAAVSTAKYQVPGHLGVFCRRHPGIDVALTVGNREELLARFAANEDDLYILGTVPEDLDAEHRTFARNLLVLVAPPDHPLTGQADVPPARLADEIFVMRERGSGSRSAAERFFAAHGLAPRVRMELGSNEAVKQAVAAGLGLSVISRGTALLELEHGVLHELPVAGFPLVRDWHVAWPRGKHLSIAAQTFLTELQHAPEFGQVTAAEGGPRGAVGRGFGVSGT
ncbi:MAG: LysR substrate-binding domain-containing protein [Gemmobacter sp.]|uniref:LysR family transcriptional regulator n=1 Tax=Gemmobacter sp. TaxID=1898957 RepID=UPI00391980A8